MFKLGRMVELTREDQRELDELSREMQRLASRRQTGWLGAWARAHANAGRVLKRAIERSHAS